MPLYLGRCNRSSNVLGAEVGGHEAELIHGGIICQVHGIVLSSRCLTLRCEVPASTRFIVQVRNVALYCCIGDLNAIRVVEGKCEIAACLPEHVNPAINQTYCVDMDDFVLTCRQRAILDLFVLFLKVLCIDDGKLGTKLYTVRVWSDYTARLYFTASPQRLMFLFSVRYPGNLVSCQTFSSKGYWCSPHTWKAKSAESST